VNYPTPQYPQAPQQTYPQQGYGQQYPAQQQFPQAPAPQQYPAQGFPQQGAAQTPGPPLAQGSIDDFYGQPSTGSGPSISWKDKPVGTAYAGIVARDVTSADIQQQTDFTTKAPQFYRDGRPKFVMKVPLKVQPSPEFPEGEATLFVRGQMRDELVRAMSEAGVDGAPRAGAGILVTLSGKRNSGQGLNPANQFTIQYTAPAGGQAPAAPPSAPEQQYTQPVPEQAPQPAPPAPQVQQQQSAQHPQVPAQAPQATQAPQSAPVPPSDLSAEQQALLAKLTGG
jgi:hypothetical protein